MKSYFRKADLFLLLTLLFLGGVSAVAVLHCSGKVQTVEITVNGQQYGSYPLTENRTVTVETEYGRNVVEIAYGKVSVTDSDCTGRDCMRFGTISSGGQVIMCLPHRLIISVTDKSSGRSPKLDAVVY